MIIYEKFPSKEIRFLINPKRKYIEAFEYFLLYILYNDINSKRMLLCE